MIGLPDLTVTIDGSARDSAPIRAKLRGEQLFSDLMPA